MAGATVTIRELKNADTCIDLGVTSYKESKGMLGSNYEYEVMVVSSLQYFKKAKHKDTDNVQFTVLRKFAEFEDLYEKINTKFSGTALTPLPKKVLMMNESVAKERRNKLDYLMKTLAMTPKLCTCSILLEFLGVNSVKAGKFRKMEVSDTVVDKQDQDRYDIDTETEQTDDTEEKSGETNDNLFDDDNNQDDDNDDDLFSSETVTDHDTDDTKLFESPDLGGSIEDGEGDDLFIADAMTTTVTKVATTTTEEEESLFKIDDDLDQIMQLNLKPKPAKTEVETKPADIESKPLQSNIDIAPAEQITSPKPSLPNKPKPAIRAKPVIQKRTDQSESTIKNKDSSFDNLNSNDDQSKSSLQKPAISAKPKPPVKQKPQLAQKPDIKTKPKLPTKPNNSEVKPTSNGQNSDTKKGDNSDSKKEENSDPLTEDDIMKYIQNNTEAEDDLDLFS